MDHKNAKLWLPPGGHVEPGEHPQDAVRREMREELGIEADFLFQDPLFLTVTETTGCPESHTDVSLWYVLKGKKGTSFDYDEKEFDQIAWFKESEIPYQRTDPHMQRFIGKLMEELSSFSAYDRLLSF